MCPEHRGHLPEPEQRRVHHRFLHGAVVPHRGGKKNLRVYRRMVLLHLISVLCILVLTGPVYSKPGHRQG